MNVNEAIERFESLSLDDLRSTLMSYHEQQIDETINWVARLRSDLLETLREVDDSDAEMALAVAYAEMKARWIAFNTKMNYKLLRKGIADPADVFRGYATYWLNTVIMGMLSEEDVERIDEFLAEPLKDAA